MGGVRGLSGVSDVFGGVVCACGGLSFVSGRAGWWRVCLVCLVCLVPGVRDLPGVPGVLLAFVCCCPWVSVVPSPGLFRLAFLVLHLFHLLCSLYSSDE